MSLDTHFHVSVTYRAILNGEELSQADGNAHTENGQINKREHDSQMEGKQGEWECIEDRSSAQPHRHCENEAVW